MKEIVYRAKHGDEKAFSQLVKRYSRWSLGLASAFVGIDKAEDIAQEMWITVWKNLKSLKDANALKSWMRTTLIRIALKSGKNPFSDVLYLDEEISTCHHSLQESELEILEELVLKEKLEQVYSTLNDQERVLITLYGLEQMSMKEIAVELNLQIGTVKSKIHYMKQKIKSLDSKKEDAYG